MVLRVERTHTLRYWRVHLSMCDFFAMILFRSFVFFVVVVCMCVCVGVVVCVCVFIKLHIIAQSGPVILVILCHSR